MLGPNAIPVVAAKVAPAPRKLDGLLLSRSKGLLASKRLRINQYEGNARLHISSILPIVVRATLNHDIAGVHQHFTFVHHTPDVASQNNREIDRASAMHHPVATAGSFEKLLVLSDRAPKSLVGRKFDDAKDRTSIGWCHLQWQSDQVSRPWHYHPAQM